MRTPITKEERRCDCDGDCAECLRAEAMAERKRAESAEHGLRYLSTLVLGRSEGTAEEIGAAHKRMLATLLVDLSDARGLVETLEECVEVGEAALTEERRAREAAEAQVAEEKRQKLLWTESAAQAMAREASKAEAMVHVREVLRFHLPVGHDGDEDSGRCYEECERCAFEGAIGHIDAALASEGSEMLERVRKAQAEVATLKAEVDRLRAENAQLRLGIPSKEPNVQERVQHAFRQGRIAECNIWTAREHRTSADLDAANALLRGLLPVLDDSQRIALHKAAADIRAHLDGKGGGLGDAEALHDEDPHCAHDIVDAPGGGVRCTKCSGWFCY